MAALKIPDRYKAGIKILAALPAPQFEGFLAAARRAPKTFTTSGEFEAWAAPEVPTIPAADLSKLIYSITSLYRLPVRYGVTASKLASDVLEGARAGITDFQVVDGTEFVERLTALLSIESFNIVAVKAKELQTESERIFVEARILTDIRPIFGNKIEDDPTASVIVHTLKIVSHENSGHKEYFFALDADDIASLKKTMERATDKVKSLKALLDGTKLRAIDLE